MSISIGVCSSALGDGTWWIIHACFQTRSVSRSAPLCWSQCWTSWRKPSPTRPSPTAYVTVSAPDPSFSDSIRHCKCPNGRPNYLHVRQRERPRSAVIRWRHTYVTEQCSVNTTHTSTALFEAIIGVDRTINILISSLPSSKYSTSSRIWSGLCRACFVMWLNCFCLCCCSVMEGTLPSSLKHVISNAEYYGSSLFLLGKSLL